MQADILQQSLSTKAWNCCSFTFDLFNPTIKKKQTIFFMNLCNAFFKPVQRVFSLQNKAALWSEQNCFPIKDRFSWHGVGSKETNHWNLAAKEFHIFVFSYAHVTRTLLNETTDNVLDLNLQQSLFTNTCDEKDNNKKLKSEMNKRNFEDGFEIAVYIYIHHYYWYHYVNLCFSKLFLKVTQKDHFMRSFT